MFVPVRILGGHPPIRNKVFMGPCKASKGTNTKVTSAKGHFCAYPIIIHWSDKGFDTFGGNVEKRSTLISYGNVSRSTQSIARSLTSEMLAQKT